MDYDAYVIAEVYDKARAPLPATARLWQELLADYIDPGAAPAPGRAPPRAIDCFLRLNLFKAPPFGLVAAVGDEQRLQPFEIGVQITLRRLQLADPVRQLLHARRVAGIADRRASGRSRRSPGSGFAGPRTGSQPRSRWCRSHGER